MSMVFLRKIRPPLLKYIEELKKKVERLNQEITYEQNTADDNALAMLTVQILEKRFLISVFSERRFLGLLVSMLEVLEELDLNMLEAGASCTNTFHLEAVGGER